MVKSAFGQWVPAGSWALGLLSLILLEGISRAIQTNCARVDGELTTLRIRSIHQDHHVAVVDIHAARATDDVVESNRVAGGACGATEVDDVSVCHHATEGKPPRTVEVDRERVVVIEPHSEVDNVCRRRIVLNVGLSGAVVEEINRVASDGSCGIVRTTKNHPGHYVARSHVVGHRVVVIVVEAKHRVGVRLSPVIIAVGCLVPRTR